MTDTASPFPTTMGRERGYDIAAVDAFLTRAREAFENQSVDSEAQSVDADRLTSRTIRQAAFPLVKEGYRIDAVDAALSRVEDAFAAREKKRAIAQAGAEVWVDKAKDEARILLDRCTRPAGERFRRVSWPRWGYDVAEVDRVADRIAGYVSDGRPLSVDQVRHVAFRMKRHGYDEAQVDAVLDATIDLLLAVGRA